MSGRHRKAQGERHHLCTVLFTCTASVIGTVYVGLPLFAIMLELTGAASLAVAGSLMTLVLSVAVVGRILVRTTPHAPGGKVRPVRAGLSAAVPDFPIAVFEEGLR